MDQSLHSPDASALLPTTREELLLASLRQKEAMRDRLAKLPFEEKIRILVQMQKRASVILAQRGISRPVWPLPKRLTSQ